MTKPYQRPAADEPAWWFIISGADILVRDEQKLPPHGQLESLAMPDLSPYQVVYLGQLRERNCYLVVADYGDNNFGALGEFVSLREILALGDDDLFAHAARAKQITEFLSTHKFCGRCGTRMQAVDWELAMHCHRCEHRCYPVISPCIIIAIRRQNTLLLARGKRHPEGLYSVLAGFAEAGEPLEQTIAREVFEEAGIRIKNARYIGSQAWPFPHSLMIGFIADWDSGDLRLDPFELEDGDWYDIEHLPRVPFKGTIARRLIDTIIAEIEQEHDGS